MCSVQPLREFIRERLAAAAEEIFSEVENTIRLLETSWRTQIHLEPTVHPGLQQLKVSEEEVLSDQQLWNQERNHRSDLEEAEPRLGRDEEAEPRLGQDEEQPPLKQEETLTAPQIREIFGGGSSSAQFEGEVAHRRRLLDPSWKPEMKPHRTEPPQQHVSEEQVLTGQQLWNHGRNWSLDKDDSGPPRVKQNQEEPEIPLKQEYQEEPEPPVLKQNQEELCICEEEEQLVMHPDSETFMATLTDGESDQSEPEPNPGSEPPQRSKVKSMKSSQRRRRKHAEGSSGSDSLDDDDDGGGASSLMSYWRTSRAEDALSAGPEGGEPSTSSPSRERSSFSKSGPCGTPSAHLSAANWAQRTQAAESLYSCNTCGKRFRFNCRYLSHMRTHTGEKPFSCRQCGKSFTQGGSLWRHVRTHSGEKPFICKTCGRSFSQKTGLLGHIRTQHGGGEACSG
ncbi:uncharacterized protein FYW61_011703 [Anableps anableps]